MTNYIQEGDRLQVVAPSGGIASGAFVLVGLKGTVAVTGGVEGETVVVATEGVYEIAKATGAINAGVKVYWDATNSVITTTASGNTLVGWAFKAAASGDATVQICLNKGV